MSLYIFDKDGTLVRFTMRKGVPHAPQRPEDQLLFKGVFEKIEILRAGHHAIAIATNQTAVADGILKLAEAERLVENCAAKIGGVDAWRLSPYSSKAKKTLKGCPNPYARDDESRKPHPGMLLEIMAALGYSPSQTFMVGDKDGDQEAAEAAGVQFIKGKEFFS